MPAHIDWPSNASCSCARATPAGTRWPIDPFYESLFFVGVISFLMMFLLLLIRDLDNPFGYYERSSGEDVSLKPIEDLIARVRRGSDGEATKGKDNAKR